jgi:DNA primase
MALSRETVAAVKDRADILEVIGERVRLAPSGSDYVGLCPFHGEKTPSFRVSPAWRTYHCFGCGVGGSVVDFVMAAENRSFAEAVVSLAERYGVPLPDAPHGGGGDRSLQALEAGRDYYRELLHDAPRGEPARRYLRERGFEEEDWGAFQLGFAPDGWQGFTDFGLGRGFSSEELLATGLVRQGQTGRCYDMLRKRVVFPIGNEQGRPIAFGGRVIDPLDAPKYLNTPETRHYHKGRVLFGLAQGLAALRASRRAVLVEGYLDVMRLHQQGFAEALATCGTALTEEHLKALERNAERAVLVFDGDDAGVKAALRSAPLFLNHGLEARVVLLPDGLDPDDFLARRGAEAFAALLEDAAPLLEFLVFQQLQRHGRSVTGKEKTLESLLPVLAQVKKAAARDLTVRYLADLIGVRSEAILAQLEPLAGRVRGARGAAATPPAPSLAHREGLHQRRVLRLLLQQPDLLGEVRRLLRPEELSDPALRGMLERLLGFSDEEYRQVSPAELMDWFPELAPTVRALMMDDPVHRDAIVDCGRELRRQILSIKDALKEELFAHLRAVAGSAEEEPAMERLRQLRRELSGLREPRVTHKTRPEHTLRAPAAPPGAPPSAPPPPEPVGGPPAAPSGMLPP